MFTPRSDVCSRLAVEDCLSPPASIGPVAPVEGIGAVPTVEEVITASALDVVVSAKRVDSVSNAVANQRVGSVCARYVFDAGKKIQPTAGSLACGQVGGERLVSEPANLVSSRPAEVRVVGLRRSSIEEVVAPSASNSIASAPTGEKVVASTTKDAVIAFRSVQTLFIPTSTPEPVIALETDHEVISRPSIRFVCTGTEDQFIKAAPAADDVSSSEASDNVVTTLRNDHVPSRGSNDAIRAVRSHNGWLMAEASGGRLRPAGDRADGKGAQRNYEKRSCRPRENGLAHLPIEPPPWRRVKPSGVAGGLLPRTRLP